MQHEQVRFVVSDDFALDSTLIQEAWLGEREVADVRQVTGVWQVAFFPTGHSCELSWEVFTKIFQAFSLFVAEQGSSLPDSEEGVLTVWPE